MGKVLREGKAEWKRKMTDEEGGKGVKDEGIAE
jgi:hypothetical protein